jgi:16S rRNA U1498 N3-methylase RsmE
VGAEGNWSNDEIEAFAIKHNQSILIRTPNALRLVKATKVEDWIPTIEFIIDEQHL